MGGGVSVAIRWLLPVAAGRGPGFEPESPGKGESGVGRGGGAPGRSAGRMRSAIGAGTSCAWQVDRSTRCLGTG